MASTTITRRRYYDTTGGKYENSRYADPHMDAYRAFRNSTLLSILQSQFSGAPLKILEVGCGTGLTLQFLSKALPECSLYGVDLSDTMLRQAADKRSTLANAPALALGDADRLPFQDGSFDVVLSTRFIHQFSHEVKQQLWREFTRVTRPGGALVMEFYARPYHLARYHVSRAAKGRAKDVYLSHFPTRHEVRDIVGHDFEVHPLRLPGSRLLVSLMGERLAGRATHMLGRASRGVFMDEYFVVSRKR